MRVMPWAVRHEAELLRAPPRAADHSAEHPGMSAAPSDPHPASVVVLVPIYQTALSALETYSLDHSLPLLQGREVRFIGPRGLDLSLYKSRYPGVPFDAFEPDDFASIPGYNRLLLSQAFHDRFANFEFLLILQTDAILLRDELDHWAGLPYDYVGAPWPQGVQIHVNLDCFDGDRGRTVRALVGNGGLSMRRVQACRALLDEFPQAVDMFLRSGSSEDLFFSVMGQLSAKFVLPNERVAGRFARELEPARYHAVDPTPPMGGHAWWKYDLPYWQRFLHLPLPEQAIQRPYETASTTPPPPTEALPTHEALNV
jgi:Protein of unknown function (DUF5672)